MKKIWIIAAAAVVISSCSKDSESGDGTTPNEEVVGQKITATINMPQSKSVVDTKISSDYGEEEWIFTWDAEDKADKVFSVYTTENEYKYASLTSESIADGASSAQFTGTLTSPKQYNLIYTSGRALWSETESKPSISGETIQLNLEQGQNGELNNLVMVGEPTVVEGEEDININPGLNHVGGFMVLNINFENVPEHWRNVTLDTIIYEGLNTQCIINPTANGVFDDGFYSDFVKKEIVILPESDITVESGGDDDDAIAKFYLNILPTTLAVNESLTVTLAFSNGTSVVLTKTNTSGEAIDFNRAEFSTNNFECDFDVETLRYPFEGSGDSDTYFVESTKNYTISTTRHLTSLAALANDGKISDGTYTFTLSDDIDLSSVGEFEWPTIGYSTTNPFVGVFDGAGHKISNYQATISTDAAETFDSVFYSLGLFGYVYGTETVVKNLIIENGDNYMARAGMHCGILAGTMQNSTIVNCGCDANSSAQIYTRGALGGLVGKAYDGVTIYNSYNYGSLICKESLSGNNINVGGLCGTTYQLDASVNNINNCISAGTFEEIVATDEISEDVDADEGTVSAGAFAGTIKGGDNFTGIYYLIFSESGFTTWIGTGTPGILTYYSRSETQFKDGTVVTQINGTAATLAGETSLEISGWETGESGYPTLTFTNVLNQ